MTSPRRIVFICLAAGFCVLSACEGITLGPVVKREFILVRAGHPIQILSNVAVQGRRLDDDSIARVEIGGWIAMPPEHWEVVKGVLNGEPQR